MFLVKRTILYMNKDLKKLLTEYDTIVLGAGSGLSAAAGFEYGGKTFMDNFSYMHDLYGYTDMYTAGFHDFDTLNDYWAFWAKMVYLNRYKYHALPLYKKLYELLKDKNYFIITTNVDHQFRLAGFDKMRIFYMQGDYGLFQCSASCHNKTYDNEKMIIEMINNTTNHKIPNALIPVCPKCGRPMTMNLRCDDLFVEDDGLIEANKRYINFIKNNNNKKILFLELGVGYSTPGWIKYPFMNFVYSNKEAKYVVVNKEKELIPSEIKNQTLIINDDIKKVIM